MKNEQICVRLSHWLLFLPIELLMNDVFIVQDKYLSIFSINCLMQENKYTVKDKKFIEYIMYVLVW